MNLPNFRVFHVHTARAYYPHLTKWIVKDETIRYLFELSYPQIPRTTHPNNSTKIAVCSGCKSNPDGRLSYRLASIPACIEHVPYTKKISLSRLSSYPA